MATPTEIQHAMRQSGPYWTMPLTKHDYNTLYDYAVQLEAEAEAQLKAKRIAQDECEHLEMELAEADEKYQLSDYLRDRLANAARDRMAERDEAREIARGLLRLAAAERRVNLPEYIQIAGERLRQDGKFGRDRQLASETWLRICIEELGEASKEIENGDPAAMRKEIVEAAAVLVAWLECNRAALAGEDKE